MRLTIPNYSRRELTFPGGWTLYRLQEDGRHSFLWPRFKLLLPPGTPAQRGRRRSYDDIRWSPLAQRFAKSPGPGRLQADNPGLYAMVELHMSLQYPPSWLTDPEGAGVTAEEIRVELERLRELRKQKRARKHRALFPDVTSAT